MILTDPPGSPSLHDECSTCFMKPHKKTMKGNKQPHLQHRDGRILHSKATLRDHTLPQNFGKRASIIPVAGGTPTEAL